MTTIPQLPFRQASPLDIAPDLRALQRGIVHRVRTATGDEAWLVIDYAQVRRLLADDRLGRSHPDPENAPRVAESALFGNPVGNFETEASDHAQMRELLQPHFSPRHLHALAPRVEELTTALLDELAEQGPPADLHSKLAVPLPVLVICELLGVRNFRSRPIQVLVRGRGQRGGSHAFRERAGCAIWLQPATGAAQARPPRRRRDLRLCGEDVDDTGATLLTLALIFAGHETTVVQIDQGVLRLLANRDQWRTLQDEPALVPKAVEELMRASNFNTLGGVPRYARTDFDFDGVTIRPGTSCYWTLGRPTATRPCSSTLSGWTSRASRPVTSLLDTVHTIA